MKVIKTKSELEDLVSKGKTVVLKISASWCGPCKVLTKTIEEIEPIYSKVDFVEVDIDNVDDELLRPFSIRSVPKVVIFAKGEIVNEFVGNRSRQDIIKILDSIE